MFVSSMSLAALLHIAGFLLLVKNPLESFRAWYRFVTTWQEGFLSLEPLNHPNISIMQAMFDWSRIIEIQLGFRVGLSLNQIISNQIIQHGQTFLYLAALALIGIFFATYKSVSKLSVVVTLMCVACLLTGIVWACYQCFAVAVALLLMQERSNSLADGKWVDSIESFKYGNLSRPTAIVLLLATVNSCFNLPIASEVLPFAPPVSGYSASFHLASPLWVLFMTCAAVDAIRMRSRLGSPTS